MRTSRHRTVTTSALLCGAAFAFSMRPAQSAASIAPEEPALLPAPSEESPSTPPPPSIASVPPAQPAPPPQPPSKRYGLILGVGLAREALPHEGDFDGWGGLIKPPEVFEIPRLESANGFTIRAAMGGQSGVHPNFALYFGFGFSRIGTTGTLRAPGPTSRSDVAVYHIPGEIEAGYFSPKLDGMVLASLQGGWSSLSADQAHVTLGPEPDDAIVRNRAKFSAAHLGLGVRLVKFIGPHFFVDGSVHWRYLVLTEASSGSTSMRFGDDKPSGTGYQMQLGVGLLLTPWL